jgi:dipeptidyl-peptidase-4
MSGIADFVISEEFDRFTGHWWSRDGTTLCYTQVDYKGVQQVQVQDVVGNGWESHYYPTSGTPNAQQSLWLVDVRGGGSYCVDTLPPYEYIVSVYPTSRGFVTQLLNRDQSQLSTVLVGGAEGGGSSVLYVESHSTWINTHQNSLWEYQGGLLWQSTENIIRYYPPLPPELLLDTISAMEVPLS